MTNEIQDLPVSKLLADAAAAVRRSDYRVAEGLLAEVVRRRRQAGDVHGNAERQLVDALRRRCDEVRAADPAPAQRRQARVGDADVRPLPGVSVVTCCMNRTENLLKALPTWLAHERVSEVVIVDWSSSVPVADSLREAGIRDRRIRVARASGERRWILSYAFNLGFRLARHEFILKADADITLKPDFFERNPLRERIFIAGNWEVAEKGQEHINGFFYVHRVDLLRIKGFNEYITTYGWDDDDIYARLTQSGIERVCVDTSSIYHIPHDDAQRLGGTPGGSETALSQLAGDTLFKIRSNRYIASVMPAWNGDRLFAPFAVVRDEAGYIEVQRIVAEMPHLVSADIRDDAKHYAALELVSWRVGPSAYHLSRSAFATLLGRKRLEEISQFDVDVALIGGEPLAHLQRHSLYLHLTCSLSDEQRQDLAVLLNRELRGGDIAIFVHGDSAEWTRELLGELHVPAMRFDGWVRHKGLRQLGSVDLPALRERTASGSGAALVVNAEVLQVLWGMSAAPAVTRRRRKLYVDTQHGLGNRLRALGSAAAVARATDRELVVLWKPDHHCDCRLRDLFDYDGAVIEDAAELPSDLRRYNYMVVEPGAVKGEVIDTDQPRDLLVRSAFVLAHPCSQWDAENAELQALQPTREVMSLVDSVPLPASCIGVHVRMEAGPGLDQNSYDAANNWSSESHDAIHFWRSKSHYSAFIRRLDQLVQSDPKQRIFLATDLPKNYEVFRQVYGDRLLELRRTHWDRSRQQILSGLADAMLLSRCSRLLGSTWSSFSELAMRLSTTFSSIEMSGKDF